MSPAWFATSSPDSPMWLQHIELRRLMASTQQFCTFFLDGHVFGTPVPKVQEVIQHQEMTRVPLAPPVVSGLINLRGQIVSAIDLAPAWSRRPANRTVADECCGPHQ